MRFESLEELIRFIITKDIDVSGVDFSMLDAAMNDPNGSESEEVEPVVEGMKDVAPILNPQVKLTSLTGVNEMVASVGDENILYVDSYEAVKDYCGTGKINVFGKTLVVNMCEMDNVAQTKMSIDINGVSSYNVDFKLRLLSEKPEGEPVIQLKETLLDVNQA